MPDDLRSPDLRSLQRWFAALVRHPSSADAGADQLPARGLVAPDLARSGGVVRGSARLAPLARVQIYTRAYALRMFGAIAEDYPGLRAAVGETAFETLVHGYLRAHPSRHQNLIFAGRDLPTHIPRAALVPHRDFAADVARVEWAMTEAFHAGEFTVADLSVLATLDADATERVRLRPNPSLRVLALRYPVVPFLDAVRDDLQPRVPDAQHTWAAVYRHDDRVFRVAIPGFAYRALIALGEGRPLGEALTDADPALVGAWFERWSAHGFFTAVDVD